MPLVTDANGQTDSRGFSRTPRLSPSSRPEESSDRRAAVSPDGSITTGRDEMPSCHDQGLQIWIAALRQGLSLPLRTRAS
jgi:hypothetical protein